MTSGAPATQACPQTVSKSATPPAPPPPLPAPPVTKSVVTMLTPPGHVTVCCWKPFVIRATLLGLGFCEPGAHEQRHGFTSVWRWEEEPAAVSLWAGAELLHDSDETSLRSFIRTNGQKWILLQRVRNFPQTTAVCRCSRNKNKIQVKRLCTELLCKLKNPFKKLPRKELKLMR